MIECTDDEHNDGPDNGDLPLDEESKPGDGGRDGDSRLSASLGQLLLSPNGSDDLTTGLREQIMRSVGLPGPFGEQLEGRVASTLTSISTFLASTRGRPSALGSSLNPSVQGIFEQIEERHASNLNSLRQSLGTLVGGSHVGTGMLRGIQLALLPPNLKEHVDEISPDSVHRFVEQEGIPLYLVPRGPTALRLLRAKDRAQRRRVLSDCYDSLTADCAAVLERSDHQVISDEIGFVLDGLGAMRSGYVRSAQAMFTVTLDTLIYRFYPEGRDRSVITIRTRGADVPAAIDEMGVREALVWLPIWNAHEEFRRHRGDTVPHYYSRHASVHGVSARQFSKRNCIQVLMLVTSLIGYADRLAREAG